MFELSCAFERDGVNAGKLSLFHHGRKQLVGRLAPAPKTIYLTRVLPDIWSEAVAPPERLTTILSTKGQVILPKAIRDSRHWDAGTHLIVENRDDGVLLKAAPIFPLTQPEDVFASLPRQGAPKTLAEIEAGIMVEARRRHARGRY